MSPTLLGLSALLRIRLDGDSISALLLEEDFSIPPLTLGFEKNLSYQTFIQTYRKDEGPEYDKEYLSFLTFWISRYLTCPRSYKVVKSDLHLAQALATGCVLALGPFLLSKIYCGCYRLISYNLVTWKGPLWIL